MNSLTFSTRSPHTWLVIVLAKQPEGKVSAAIIKMIRERGGEAYKVHGNEFTPRGTPDISGCYKGFSIWLETKMPGNKPTLIQWKRMRDWRRAGAFTCVPYSVQDAVQMLDHIDVCNHVTNDKNCLYRSPIDLQHIIDTKQYKKGKEDK